MDKVKKHMPTWLVLTVIALCAGLLLGVTNELTSERITARRLAEEQQNRSYLMPLAQDFEELQSDAENGILSCYRAVSGEETLGYVITVETNGFGGKIEVMTGVNSDGSINGIRVGGKDFSETAGLGAKVKDDAFTGQFAGLTPPAVLKQNVDSVTAASISSQAVTDAVNQAANYAEGLL